MMNPQLAELVLRNEEVSRRVERLVMRCSTEQLGRTPAPGRWSAIQCIEHLNISAEKTFPMIRSGIAGMAMLPRTERDPYTMDIMGRMLNWSLKPGSSFKIKTPQSFIPEAIADPAPVLEKFGAHQRQLSTIIADADGLPLAAVKITSAFNNKVRYNLFSAITILITHAERHLLQAEQAIV